MDNSALTWVKWFLAISVIVILIAIGMSLYLAFKDGGPSATPTPQSPVQEENS